MAGWAPAPAPTPLTSRRLRSAGCSLKERLRRYCHRGLSSGGSSRFSRRSRHEEQRLPAGREGCWVRAGDPNAPAGGEPQPQQQPRDRALPRPARPARGASARGAPARLHSPRKRPVAKAAPRAADPRASAAGTESRGIGWIMARAGRGGGQVPGARAPSLGGTRTLGPSCSASSPALLADCGLGLHLAAAQPYCKPCPRERRSPSGGCSRNFARRRNSLLAGCGSLGQGGKS